MFVDAAPRALSLLDALSGSRRKGTIWQGTGPSCANFTNFSHIPELNVSVPKSRLQFPVRASSSHFAAAAHRLN